MSPYNLFVMLRILFLKKKAYVDQMTANAFRSFNGKQFALDSPATQETFDLFNDH